MPLMPLGASDVYDASYDDPDDLDWVVTVVGLVCGRLGACKPSVSNSRAQYTESNQLLHFAPIHGSLQEFQNPSFPEPR